VGQGVLLCRYEARRVAIPGNPSWYLPWGCCHWIAFFSMAIGVLNNPRLDWRFVSGDLHTVPVGYGPDGKPAVVMDILLFEGMSAEQSLALGLPQGKWSRSYGWFGLCLRSNSSGDRNPKEEWRRTRL
jgi:hypothetical protein